MKLVGSDLMKGVINQYWSASEPVQVTYAYQYWSKS